MMKLETRQHDQALSYVDRQLLTLMTGNWHLDAHDTEALLKLWRDDSGSPSLADFAQKSGLLQPQAGLTLNLLERRVLKLANARHLLAKSGAFNLKQLIKGPGEVPEKPLAPVRSPVPPPLAIPRPAPRATQAGDRIGKCIISRVIGGGSSCRVYEAMHETLQIPVAVKIFHPHDAQDEAFRAMFSGEARQLARLVHPNIIRVLDFEDGDTPFIVMEYAGGLALSEILRVQHALTISRTLSVLHESAGALRYAHDAGIIHRDVKPANLLFDDHGTIKLADLGIARFGQVSKESWQQASQGLLCGTPLYIAPEQAFQPDAVDHRADIYALGATIYHTLAGEPPFSGASARELVLKHVSAVPRQLRELRPEIPPELEALVHAMLAKDPADRPSSMAEVATLTERLIAAPPIIETAPLRGTKTITMLLRDSVRRSLRPGTGKS